MSTYMSCHNQTSWIRIIGVADGMSYHTVNLATMYRSYLQQHADQRTPATQPVLYSKSLNALTPHRDTINTNQLLHKYMAKYGGATVSTNAFGSSPLGGGCPGNAFNSSPLAGACMVNPGGHIGVETPSETVTEAWISAFPGYYYHKRSPVTLGVQGQQCTTSMHSVVAQVSSIFLCNLK